MLREGVKYYVHRRTGGLEMKVGATVLYQYVHRRTGGLETWDTTPEFRHTVHRRTGGLEMPISF